MLQSFKEPYINLSELFDTRYGITFLQGLCDSKDTQVGGVSQLVVEVVELSVVVAHEAMHALTNHAQTLLNHFLKRTTDTHYLTYRLH